MQNVFAASILMLACALSGCSSLPTTATLADGTVAYRIDCDGSRSGLNYCFEKAGKSCGAEGYTIVDQSGTRLSNSKVADGDMASLIKAYEMDKNSILIRCGS